MGVGEERRGGKGAQVSLRSSTAAHALEQLESRGRTHCRRNRSRETHEMVSEARARRLTCRASVRQAVCGSKTLLRCASGQQWSGALRNRSREVDVWIE